MRFAQKTLKTGEDALVLTAGPRDRRISAKQDVRTITAHKTEFRRRISATLQDAEHFVKHPTSKYIGNSKHVETKRDVFSEWVKSLRQLRNQIPELQTETDTRPFSKEVGYYENLVRIVVNKGQDYAVAEHLRQEVYGMLKLVNPLIKKQEEFNTPASNLMDDLTLIKIKLMEPATADFATITRWLGEARADFAKIVPQQGSPLDTDKPAPEGIMKR